MPYVLKFTPFSTFITGFYFDSINPLIFACLDMTLFLFPYPTKVSWPVLIMLLAGIFRLMFANETAFGFFLIPLILLFSILIGSFWHQFQSKNETTKYREQKIQFVTDWYTEIAPKIMRRRSPSASQKYIFDKNRKRITKYITEEDKQNPKKKQRKPHRKKK